MHTFRLALLVGIVAVLTLDTLGSLASRHFNFPYSRLWVLSSLTYLLVGAIAAKADSFSFAVLAAALVGLTDSTLGRVISWHLGPGRMPTANLTAARVGTTIIIVTFTASSIGALGAGIRRMLN